MDKVRIKQLYLDSSLYHDKDLVLNGWIRNNRDQKSFGFISLNDGTCFQSLQIVYEKDLLDNFEQVAKLGVGAAVRVEGKLVLTPQAKQPFEVKASVVSLEGDSAPDYPIQPKRHSREFLREVAHLRPRTNLFSAVFRVRSLLAYAVHRFFQEKGFICLHAPIITANDAEGAGEIFRVTTLDPATPPLNEDKTVDFSADFFGKKANLTVSGQLEAEAFALAFKDVYTFGPTFRAENSNTARHAAEFWMIEPEIAFADLADNMNLAEEMVKYLINAVLEEAPEEMSFFSQFVDQGLRDRLQKILASNFARITYGEAVERLKKVKQPFEYPVEWGSDLQTEHERYLTEKVFNKPVFVTDYPKQIKAFYMRLNDDQNTVAAMDLLVPGVGEIIGGSQREERAEVLMARMADYNINPEELSWYLDLRRYGGVKHAGFGLGFERALMYLTGVSNIRDVIPFPRTVKSCEF
jgi:asparaginyl-tRNA synthetase